MNNQKTAVLAPPPAAIWAKPRALAESIPGSVFLGFVALVMFSQIIIPLPFTPVPLSMGTLGAMLLGVFLGPRKGAAAATVYAVAGVAGIPVFAGFQAGYQLSSFGYVLGYIAAAVVMGLVSSKRTNVAYLRGFAEAILASASIYVFGVIWMIAAFGFDFISAIQLGVLPFLVGDIIKSLVVAGVMRGVKA